MSLQDKTEDDKSDTPGTDSAHPALTSQNFSKMIIKQGQGFTRPYMESRCVLDITHISQKDVFSENNKNLMNLKIPLGANIELHLGSAETEAVRILEKCILTMRKGEESQFVINCPRVVFPQEIQKIQEPVTVNVILCDFSETKPIWALTFEEKYELALHHKEKGSQFFSDNKIEAAFCQFSIAIVYLICISEYVKRGVKPEMTPEKKKYQTLKCVCYLNLAACQLKTTNYKCVVTNCTHALSLDANNVKGLYRRAQAYLASGHVEKARLDLTQALTIEPKNKAVAELYQKCGVSS